jgi:hypothetical protein
MGIRRAKEALVGDNGNEIAPGKEEPKDWPEARDAIADDLERQARETMRVIRESAGDLGTRVRQVLDHAATLWNQAGPGAPTTTSTTSISPAHELRARTLARRWRTIDFLVDPELADGMIVGAVEDAAAWRVELRERGEMRVLAEVTEPYRGDRPVVLAPTLPAWDYSFPAVPEIAAGERRERLADSGMIGACLTCNGTGHQACRHCDGKGFVECPTCHGRARVMCRRCRGRGRIADSHAERQARASKSYLQVHAERIATDAAGRLADLSERLRQEYGVPLPPSADWMPTAPASGETIPCPDCIEGKVKCSCGNGKLVCDVCRGSGHAACASCGGSGRVVRFREVVRRFDMRHSSKVIPANDFAVSHLIDVAALRRATGDVAWEGSIEQLDASAPASVPGSVWGAAQELAREHVAHEAAAEAAQTARAAGGEAKPKGERRVLARQMHITRIPLTHVEYTFAGHPFAFLAVGHSGTERFWAETFPPRWSRVGRFFKAVMRDLEDVGGDVSKPEIHGPADVAVLDEYRARRASHETHNGAQHVRIVEEPVVAEPVADQQDQVVAQEPGREPGPAGPPDESLD